jgi:hypothetical protein
MSKSITGCCPPFDPAKWDEQTFKFDDKLFLKFRTRSFLHIPLNMNSAMIKAMAKVEEAGATNHQEYFMLSDEASPWHTEHYLSVTKQVPDAEMVRLSGTYLAKVFEGPYKNMRSWYEQLVDYVKSKGKKPVKTYFSYTMCPACAKAYGKNYVVGFEQVE